jgi:hypothetical protein
MRSPRSPASLSSSRGRISKGPTYRPLSKPEVQMTNRKHANLSLQLP